MTKQAAATLRAQYKAAGWNARMVSVRTQYFSMGSSIRVTVRSADVDFAKAKAMAEDVERISRCQITGEILSGGNRYVHVDMSEACADALAKPFLCAVQNAVAELDGLSDGTHADVTRVEGKGEAARSVRIASVCRGRWDTGFDLWIGDRHCMAYQRDEHGYKAAAVAIATRS